MTKTRDLSRLGAKERLCGAHDDWSVNSAADDLHVAGGKRIVFSANRVADAGYRVRFGGDGSRFETRSPEVVRRSIGKTVCSS